MPDVTERIQALREQHAQKENRSEAQAESDKQAREAVRRDNLTRSRELLEAVYPVKILEEANDNVLHGKGKVTSFEGNIVLDHSGKAFEPPPRYISHAVSAISLTWDMGFRNEGFPEVKTHRWGRVSIIAFVEGEHPHSPIALCTHVGMVKSYFKRYPLDNAQQVREELSKAVFSLGGKVRKLNPDEYESMDQLRDSVMDNIAQEFVENIH